jgi:hypothetical protein
MALRVDLGEQVIASVIVLGPPRRQLKEMTKGRRFVRRLEQAETPNAGQASFLEGKCKLSGFSEHGGPSSQTDLLKQLCEKTLPMRIPQARADSR